MEKLARNINAGLGKEKAELVLKDANCVNVFNQEIEKNDIAINGDIIIGIGNYHGYHEIDCSGLFVAPGFIDSHVHIESSMVTPEIFSNIVIKNGVTTVIADPHEIANVLGAYGIEFMLENSKKAAMDIFFMLPSCVPATDFEDNGAILRKEELSKFIDNDRVLGIGEVMDVPAVINCSEDMLSKIKLAYEKNKSIDGHCPDIDDKSLNAYISCGINTDHECSSSDEALKKIQKGMYVMLREGSACKNLKNLLKAVNNNNYHRFLFCTDDRDIEDLIREGSIDNCIRTAVRGGLDAVKALTIASYNAALCYGLRERGAIAPGYKADLVVFDNLKDIRIKKIIKNGREYVNDTKYSKVQVKHSINLNFINKEAFRVEGKGKFVNVIKLIPNSVETKKEIRKVFLKNNYIDELEGEDIVKVGVFERHKNTGRRSIGYIEGLGLNGCSIAQTIAHDSHNIIVVGDDDKDMEMAVNSLISIGGGITIVSQGKLLEHLRLPIGGVMTSEPPYLVLEKVRKLNLIAREYGIKEEFDPFLTLGFMSLPVIPELKITTRGMFDFNEFKFIDLFC